MANRIFIGDVVFCLALGFLSGACAAGFGWKVAAVGAMMLCAASLFVVFVRNIEFRRRIVFASIFCAATLCGSFYCFFITDLKSSQVNLPIGKNAAFSAVISAEPKASANSILLTAKIEKPYAGDITVFAPPSSRYQYGDELSVQGKLEPPQATGEMPALFPKKITLIARNRGFWLTEALLAFKAALLRKFQALLPNDAAALMAGELFGGSDGMSAMFKSEMSASGTSYVLSMYGYKISLVIFLCEGMLASWVGRRARFILVTMVIFMIVILSGGNSSAIRAAFMAVVALAAKLSGRTFDPRNALTVCAASMTLFDPTLPAQASFELSVLSIAGIFYLVAPLQNFFGWTDRSRESGNFFAGILNVVNWREAIIIAIATLVPIIPILVVAFNDFSLTAFPSNVLISFAILPTMVAGVAIAIFAIIAPPLAVITAKLSNLILFYQVLVVRMFGAVTVPLVIPLRTPIVFIAYYSALAWFANFYGERFIDNDNPQDYDAI